VNKKANQETDWKYYPSKSNVQVYQYSDDPLAYEIYADFGEVEVLIKKLGLPLYHNRRYISAYFTGPNSPRTSNPLPRSFNNYTVEVFGIQVALPPLLRKKSKLWPTGPDIPKYMCEPIYWRESSQYGVHIWRTRIFDRPISILNPSPARPLSHPDPWDMYLEERWHPSGGLRWSINWSENLALRASKVCHFMQDALRILGYTKEKPKKWSKRRLSNPEEFINRLQDIYKIEMNRLESKPSQEIIAAGMGISRSTLARRLEEHHVTWPPDLFV
jgi:hypothetical protein